MPSAARITLITLAIGLVASSGLLRQPPAATQPEPASPLPEGAVAHLGSTRFRHRDLIQPIAFSPDGKTLYTGTADYEALYAWDAETGRLQ